MNSLSGRRGRMLLGAAGAATVLLALYLAAAHGYKHFYELLVGGLALALGAALGNGISKRTYLISYPVFLILALIGDLLFGLVVTGLWYYNYSRLWEYMLLYAWTYPVAGIVMYQTYVLVRRLFKTSKQPEARTANPRQTLALIQAALLLAALTLWWMIDHNLILLTVNFIFITLLAIALFDLAARLRGKSSLVNDLVKNPRAVITGLLATTYANLLLHEIPNTWAHEWVYTNLPWQSVAWLGVPVAVYPGWLALSLLPVAFFYAIREKE